MRHAAIYFVFTTLFALGAQTSSAQVAWEGKLREAHSKAKQQGKLMLLHFYTDNCIYCDRLEQGAFRSASVCDSINQQFIPVKVHGGKNPQLAAMFKVTKYPTDVIVTTDGKALTHSVSPQQPDRYISMLTSAQVTYAKTRTQLASQPTQPVAAPVAPTQVASKELSTSNTAPDARTAAVISAPPQTAVKTAANLQTGKPQPNNFVLPGKTQPTVQNASVESKPAVKASLASARSGGMMLPPGDPSAPAAAPMNAVTANTVAPNTVTPAATAPAVSSVKTSEKPELAIQGYCAVSVVNRGQWVEGKPELGVIHLGRLYLFADKQAMDLFLDDPVPFTPMLNEIDVVRFFEDKKIVKGKREWGVIDPIHNRMFFFADERAMLHFEESFDRYLEASIEVMDHAIKESNPGI